MKISLIFLLLIFFSSIISCTKKDVSPQKPSPTLSSAKEILTFGLNQKENPSLPQDYKGTISGSDVNITLPNGLDVSNLIATFTLPEKASCFINTTPQVSGQTSNDFSKPIIYQIKAEDGSVKEFTVNLSRSGILANTTINATTSYAKAENIKTYISYESIFKNYHIYSHLARVAFDFDKDGDEDIMAARLSDTQSTVLAEYYRNDNGIYISYPAIFNNAAPALVHPRKAIINDFNQDGNIDVILTGHGYDQPPFPGEKPYLLINQNGISFQSSLLPVNPGFYHSVTSGDVDNDGDTDLFLTDNFSGHKILLNNGQAAFTVDNTILPQDMPTQYYTSELYDLNKDGFLDLLIAGHEYENAPTVIYWGSSSGKYSTSNKSTLPAVSGKGIVIDIDFYDIDQDGSTDVLLNRTSHNPFYAGYYLQMIKNNGNMFADITSSAILANSTDNGQWISFPRFFDYDNDGDKDIVPDDKKYNLIWKNTGGTFIHQ
jgi:hypothetical protein